jgi:hypothetical protein
MAFYGANYYPEGGMDDFIGSFGKLQTAIDVINEVHKQSKFITWAWGHVYDVKKCEITQRFYAKGDYPCLLENIQL